MQTTVAILGAGSWGSAVAIHLARTGTSVLLWGHNPEHVQEMQRTQRNTRYLPNIVFPPNLFPTSSLEECVTHAKILIIAVPSHAFLSVLHQLPTLPELVWLTKGLEPQTHQLLSSLVTKRFGQTCAMAILSGPSFAKEVAQGLPTAVTLASNNSCFQQKVQSLLHQENMRVYKSDDIVGVQVCGAIKNILAIACGLSDGLGFGANTKAALITRGLTEMTRLGMAMHAQKKTFMGLAGIGDLVLTCTDNQSRNRRFGLYLGQGQGIHQAEEEIGQVVEGKYNTEQVLALAESYQVEMPICTQVQAILQQITTPREAVLQLMNRVIGEE